MPKATVGQAIFVSAVTTANAAQISVRTWYNQILAYDFQKPKINNQNHFFVQLVWRASTDVGVGVFTTTAVPKKTYVVAFFNPAGDTEDGIQYNVLPVTGEFTRLPKLLYISSFIGT